MFFSIVHAAESSIFCVCVAAAAASAVHIFRANVSTIFIPWGNFGPARKKDAGARLKTQLRKSSSKMSEGAKYPPPPRVSLRLRVVDFYPEGRHYCVRTSFYNNYYTRTHSRVYTHVHTLTYDIWWHPYIAIVDFLPPCHRELETFARRRGGWLNGSSFLSANLLADFLLFFRSNFFFFFAHFISFTQISFIVENGRRWCVGGEPRFLVVLIKISA